MLNKQMLNKCICGARNGTAVFVEHKAQVLFVLKLHCVFDGLTERERHTEYIN